MSAGVFALFLAVITGVIGALPILIPIVKRRGYGDSPEVKTQFGGAVLYGIIVSAITWWIYYSATPSLTWPLFGAVGVVILIAWVGAAIIHGFMAETISLAAFVPVVALVLFAGRGCVGSGAFNASEYASLLRKVEERSWTQDVQPKDPRHVRLVPRELAHWLADKQLGDAPGAIGSQFTVAKDYAMLQIINGELWYVYPLDFRSFSTWTSSAGAPGYVMVHGEDPNRPPIVKTDDKFIITPGAYFSDNLERYLWAHGYASKGLTEFSLELDDDLRPWWVVTVYHPSIAWWGTKVDGVVIVDPRDGALQFHATGKTPSWVDRVIPKAVVEEYVLARGTYTGGWVNSWWGSRNLTEPETPSLIFGADGEPSWVTSVTSQNPGDESLLSLVYTNTRTGKSVSYRAKGGTEDAVREAVHNAVQYKKFHPGDAFLYNIAGTMASIVPVLGESHTFQGVAIVNVETLQVAFGENVQIAYREYQKLLAGTGQEITPERRHDTEELSGIVERIAAVVQGGETVYYLRLRDGVQLFTGGGELSPKLPLTRDGDAVMIRFLQTTEDVVPLLGFNNTTLTLAPSATQQEVRERLGDRRENVRREAAERSARGTVNNMSDEELQELLKLRDAERRNSR